MTANELVDVVIVWRRVLPDGAWRVGPVLYRDGVGEIHHHPLGAPDPTQDAPPQESTSLWQRFANGLGDDDVAYDLEWHRQVKASDLDALVESRVREAASSRPGGTVAPPPRGDEPTRRAETTPPPAPAEHRDAHHADDLPRLVDPDTVADCHTLSRAWAIAAELVRRHPELRISRVVDADQNPLLLVHDDAERRQVQFDLPRWVHYAIDGHVESITWNDIFAEASPLHVVERLERALGLGLPAPSLVPDARSLAYRVIAAALAVGVDDEFTWQAVHAHIHPADTDMETFVQFPGGVDLAWRYLDEIRMRVEREGRIVFHQPVWALLRDVEVIALLDVAGRVHLPDGVIDLVQFHEHNDRRLVQTMAALLGDYLR
jgi:hypothetical protein